MLGHLSLMMVVLATAGGRDPDPDGGLRDLLSKPYESHFQMADLLSDLTEYETDDLDASVRPSLQNALTRGNLQTHDSVAPAAKLNLPRQQYYYQNVPSIYRTTTTKPTTTSTTTSTSSTSPPTPDCTTPSGSPNHYVPPSPTCPQNYSSQPQPSPGGGTAQYPPPNPAGGGTHYTISYPPITHMQPYIVVAPQIVMPSSPKSDYNEYYYDGYECACY